MGRVLLLRDELAIKFSAKRVHDLRVALRRCLSIADGMIEVSFDPRWKKMRKEGKRLFKRLGNLRDVQVLVRWVKKIAPADDRARETILQALSGELHPLQKKVRDAIDRFDRRRWKNWSGVLATPTTHLVDRPMYADLAERRRQEALDKHRSALRTVSPAAIHRLRIALKRFRYTVENFLPGLYAQWGASLKQLQDLLGEIHDLDMLSSMLDEKHLLSGRPRQAWQRRIGQLRKERWMRYREAFARRPSPWLVWKTEMERSRN